MNQLSESIGRGIEDGLAKAAPAIIQAVLDGLKISQGEALGLVRGTHLVVPREPSNAMIQCGMIGLVSKAHEIDGPIPPHREDMTREEYADRAARLCKQVVSGQEVEAVWHTMIAASQQNGEK